MTKPVKKKKPVLTDHKQVGKKFIPPLLQVGNIKTIRWQLPILPELLWLALLNSTYGLQRGAELALALANGAFRTGAHKWFASISSYELLTGLQQQEVLHVLDSNNTVSFLRQSLNDLVWFFPECPLKFLFPNGPAQPENEVQALTQFKGTLAGLYDRTEREPMMMQANAIYIAFVLGILKVAPTVSLANFPEIQNYPHTPESERVGSGIRGLINMFFGHESEQPSWWPKYFWNRGLELESCDLDPSVKLGEQ